MPEYAGLSNREDLTAYLTDADAEMALYNVGVDGQPFFAAQASTTPVGVSPSSTIKIPRLDHTAAALPPDLDAEDDSALMVQDQEQSSLMSADGHPVYILVADEAQQQQIVRQVIAAGGKFETSG